MKEAFFDNNSRVCFIGDSITANGGFIANIFEYYVKHLPDSHVRLYNTGVSGDNATAALKRLEKDVERFSPTEVVLMFGMNDVGRDRYGIDLPSEEILEARHLLNERYLVSMEKMIRYYSGRGIPVTLCSPTPYDEFTSSDEKNYTGICDTFSFYFSEIKKRVSDVKLKNTVDFLTPMMEILHDSKAQKVLIGPDRVHPTAVGHEIMSRIFLRSQGFDVKLPAAGELSALEFTERSEINKKRLSYEAPLRLLMFIEWNTNFGQENMTDAEKVAYWNVHAEEFGKNGAFHLNSAKHYAENKLREKEYVLGLIEATDAMAAG